MYCEELCDFIEGLKDELRRMLSVYNSYCSNDLSPNLPDYSPDALASLYRGDPSGIDWKVVSKDIEIFIQYRMKDWDSGKEEKAKHYCSLFD